MAIKSNINEIVIPIKTECFLIILLMFAFVFLMVCRVAKTANAKSTRKHD